jgi:type III secretion protein R
LLLVMAGLSLDPFVLLLMTSFVKVAVVLSILKGALGTPQVPPGQVVTGLASILTLFIMAPTGERMFRAVEPLLSAPAARRQRRPRQPAGAGLLAAAGDPGQGAAARLPAPAQHPARPGTFLGLAQRLRAPAERAGLAERDLQVVVPAFLTSELRRAFEIGFLLFVPFLIIDLVISNLLLALGMHMLSPTTVSLPFKLLLFVIADGWSLLLRGLVESYV